MPDVPVSLYVHFPWCIRKCPYCDFNSHEAARGQDNRRYLNALSQDIQDSFPSLAGRSIQSIFLGGGTPSLFSGTEIATILEEVKRFGDLQGDAEITLEANPGTLESDAFDAYLEAGVTRLSMGIQSFNDRNLSNLGRIHSAADARNAIERAKRAGFSNMNLDVMFALPGQDLRGALGDCEAAMAYGTSTCFFIN